MKVNCFREEKLSEVTIQPKEETRTRQGKARQGGIG
jgi:hypothetical protein